MLNARQPAVTAPLNLLRLLSAKARLRGVWHSPQCASASLRYAPRFHSALRALFGSKRRSALKSAAQMPSAQRWLKGNDSELLLAGACTGARLNKYALIAS